jgi:outer membrane protein TolC
LTGAGGSLGDSYQQVGKMSGTFWSAGLELSVPLSNTYAMNDYRRRKAQTEQLQNQINALSWLIRNDVEADLRALITARLQIQTADVSAQFAVQRLEEYRKNNVSGSATVQDVINAESDLVVAENAQWDALESFANGVTRLWRDTGELLERQEVRIDTSDPRKLTESQTVPGK